MKKKVQLSFAWCSKYTGCDKDITSRVRGGGLGSIWGQWSKCIEQHVVKGSGAHASSRPSPALVYARHCTRWGRSFSSESAKARPVRIAPLFSQTILYINPANRDHITHFSIHFGPNHGVQKHQWFQCYVWVTVRARSGGTRPVKRPACMAMRPILVAVCLLLITPITGSWW